MEGIVLPHFGRAVMLALVLGACTESHRRESAAAVGAEVPWSWSGLTLGMAQSEATHLVQKMCEPASLEAVADRSFFRTTNLRCVRSDGEFIGRQVEVTASFFDEKLAALTFSPLGDDPRWWMDLRAALVKKYGATMHREELGEFGNIDEWRSGDLRVFFFEGRDRRFQSVMFHSEVLWWTRFYAEKRERDARASGLSK